MLTALNHIHDNTPMVTDKSISVRIYNKGTRRKSWFRYSTTIENFCILNDLEYNIVEHNK